MRRTAYFILMLAVSGVCFAQTPTAASPQQPSSQTVPVPSPAPGSVPQVIPRVSAGATNVLVLPVGTRIPVVLEHAVSTKSARDGDAIYCRTNFPVVVDGRMAIPPGTYVQGTIEHSKRAGKVKGKAEVLMHFTTLIFPSGYTVMLPGSVGGMPGSDTAQMKSKDNEGTVQGDGNKAHDAATVGKVAAAGAGIGAIAGQGVKGAAEGGLAGAAIGLATVLLTRGPDVRLETGTLLEMSLEREVAIDRDRAAARN